jgi:hypothetical protein
VIMVPGILDFSSGGPAKAVADRVFAPIGHGARR